jgi:hypothetical protein
MCWFTEGEEMVRFMVKGVRASGHSPGLSSVPALSQNSGEESLSLSHTQHHSQATSAPAGQPSINSATAPQSTLCSVATITQEPLSPWPPMWAEEKLLSVFRPDESA